MPGQDVQNDTGRMDIMRQRLGTSGFYRISPIGQYGAQDVDHLPITAGLRFQPALHAADRDRQVPFPEGRTVAQGTGLAGQNRYIMQGVEDRFVAAEGAGMVADNPAILPAFQPVGASADLHGPSDRPGINRVSVPVEPHEAGPGHRRRNRVESVEWADARNKAWALALEQLPGRPVAHLGMFVRPRMVQAPIFQPSVQRGTGFELRARHEEPSPDHADLVLDLASLPP